jgi:salicylate hydroxylase
MENGVLKLEILIVGGGISGLSAATCLAQKGHHVRVYESRPGLSELGAGIQVPPNAMRCLENCGLKQAFYNASSTAPQTNIYQYNTLRLLGVIGNAEDKSHGYRYTSCISIEEYRSWGIPGWYCHSHIQIHRAEYQRLLFESALKAGAQVFFDTHVVDIETSHASIVLDDGRVIKGDIIIGADGKIYLHTKFHKMGSLMWEYPRYPL